jgi:hypothetical protein
VRLEELGLTMDDFVAVVQAAEMERRSCSPLEPSIAPGFKAWVTAFRTLAEQLIPRGWQRVETKGLPRLLNLESSVAIAVVGGDEATGQNSTESEPKSKTPRGARSVFLVRSNERQLVIPFAERGFRPLPPEQEEITWWLLIYSDGINTLRAELTLPVGLGEDRRLSVWEERIILEIPEFYFAPHDRRDDEEPPFEMEVNVRPRA